MLAVAEDPTGPYKEEFQIIPPWAHNPEAILTPDGTVAVFTLGNGIQINGDGGIHGPQVRCDLNASAPPPPAPPHVPPPPPGEHSTTADAWFLIHYATKDTYFDRAAWKVHNATIKDFPTDFSFRGGAGVGLGTYTEGNWNPAPVALPDGRVRIMVHTGWSGLPEFHNLTGWSGEVIVEAPSWKGPYKMITSRDITFCTKCEEDPCVKLRCRVLLVCSISAVLVGPLAGRRRAYRATRVGRQFHVGRSPPALARSLSPDVRQRHDHAAVRAGQRS